MWCVVRGAWYVVHGWEAGREPTLAPFAPHAPYRQVGRLADALEGAAPAPPRPAHLRDDDRDPRDPAHHVRLRDPDRGAPPPHGGARRIADPAEPGPDRPDGEHRELRPAGNGDRPGGAADRH